MRLHVYLFKFLYLIRLGYQTKRKYVRVFVLRNDVLQFIHLMYKWGFILSYFFCKKALSFILELSYVRQEPVISNMCFFLYNGNMPYIPFKVLVKLCLEENLLFYVLYTSRGILLDKDAIPLGLGGFLICSLR